MRPLLDLRRSLIASALLCAAFSSAALTLGRSRAVALIGRPLDFSVAVTLDGRDTADGLCSEADVFHGDTRVAPGQVTVGLEQVGQERFLRVRSSLPVDEPVVTVYLRLGCVQKLSRRFVLLAEPPADVITRLAGAAPAVAASTSGPGEPAAAAKSASVSQKAVSEATATPRSAIPLRAASGRKAAAAKREHGLPGRASLRAAALPAAQSAPRLTLDLLDLAPLAEPVLKSSATLAGEPTASVQQRAEAAALWRALQAQPQDVLRDVQRVQALEANLKGLRELAAENGRDLADMRGRLEKARTERTVITSVMAVLALLFAAAVVTWGLRRANKPYRDWRRRQDSPEGSAPAGGSTVPATVPADPADSTALGRTNVPRAGPALLGSRKIGPAAAPVPAAPAVAHTTRTGHSGFHPSMAASLRMVKAEELVDIQQQADFFLSLGQMDRAIDVLESHIHDNVETSALVWLDLLDIYRTLQRRDDYQLLRSDFQRMFNAEVPDFDTPRAASAGLEDYPRALSRIVALWPSPKVLEIIEESIFRKPGTPDAEPFDLEAYRELVMLFYVGKEVVDDVTVPERDLTVSAASTFSSTAMSPLTPSSEDADAQGADLFDLETPRSRRLGLDIDLSASGGDKSVDFELVDLSDATPAQAPPER